MGRVESAFVREVGGERDRLAVHDIHVSVFVLARVEIRRDYDVCRVRVGGWRRGHSGLVKDEGQV